VALFAERARDGDFGSGHSIVRGADVRLHAVAGFHAQWHHVARLSLVAGVLVDDAIVEIENIVRHMRMGKSGYMAAIDAADEIGLAVVATSLPSSPCFSLSFMAASAASISSSSALTVAAAVFISLMVARLITPVLAAYALRSDEMPAHAQDGPLMTHYLSLLRWCVANRWKTMAFGAAFFALSLGALAIIPKAFVPPEDFASSELDIELPPAASSTIRRGSLRPPPRASKSAGGPNVVEFVGGDDGEIRTANALHQPGAAC